LAAPIPPLAPVINMTRESICGEDSKNSKELVSERSQRWMLKCLWMRLPKLRRARRQLPRRVRETRFSPNTTFHQTFHLTSMENGTLSSGWRPNRPLVATWAISLFESRTQQVAFPFTKRHFDFEHHLQILVPFNPTFGMPVGSGVGE
jgi:hypothetical protein